MISIVRKRNRAFEFTTDYCCGFLFSLISMMIILPIYGVELTSGELISISGWLTTANAVKRHVLNNVYDNRND